MSTRSSPGGKYIDEMRYAEMIAAIVRLQTERDRLRDSHAKELMLHEPYDLYLGTKAVGHIGAKAPVTPAQYRAFMTRFRRLMAKKKYLTAERWEDRRQKFLIEASDIVIRSQRAPEHPELLPQAPFDGGPGAAEQPSWFTRTARSLKQSITGEKSGEPTAE